MHGGIILTKGEEEKNVLNKNNKPEINRGVELLLRNRRNVQPKPTFQLKLSHPEMFDENGNLRADEILAVRFENYDNNNEEEDNN